MQIADDGDCIITGAPGSLAPGAKGSRQKIDDEKLTTLTKIIF